VREDKTLGDLGMITFTAAIGTIPLHFNFESYDYNLSPCKVETGFAVVSIRSVLTFGDVHFHQKFPSNQ
jgi:hypothetical protein